MVLNVRQFKEHLGKRVSSAYDKRANKFLDFMDQHGQGIKQGVDDQLATIEKYMR